MLRIVWLQLERHAAAALTASLVAGARSRPNQLGSGIISQGEALLVVSGRVAGKELLSPSVAPQGCMAMVPCATAGHASIQNTGEGAGH